MDISIQNELNEDLTNWISDGNNTWEDQKKKKETFRK